jgi:hypothetical protein
VGTAPAAVHRHKATAMNRDLNDNPETVKILFAGGCHVIGYPVGDEHSFPAVAVRILEKHGVRCEIERIPYLQLHHPEKVEAVCRAFQPQVVVLQLVNWEIEDELNQHAFARFGLKAKVEPFVPVREVPTVSMRRFLLRARPKQLIDTCLGHPLVDFDRIELKIDRFLSDAGLSGVSHVVLTSPTPAADPTRSYYRAKAAPLLRAAAASRHFGFLDLLSLAPSKCEQHMGRSMFFADSSHLGITGQTAVGLSLADYLQKVIPACVC